MINGPVSFDQTFIIIIIILLAIVNSRSYLVDASSFMNYVWVLVVGMKMWHIIGQTWFSSGNEGRCQEDYASVYFCELDNGCGEPC